MLAWVGTKNKLQSQFRRDLSSGSFPHPPPQPHKGSVIPGSLNLRDTKCCSNLKGNTEVGKQQWVWGPHLPAFPALGRWRQKDQKFKVFFSYIMTLSQDLLAYKTPCLKNKQKGLSWWGSHDEFQDTGVLRVSWSLGWEWKLCSYTHATVLLRRFETIFKNFFFHHLCAGDLF